MVIIESEDLFPLICWHGRVRWIGTREQLLAEPKLFALEFPWPGSEGASWEDTHHEFHLYPHWRRKLRAAGIWILNVDCKALREFAGQKPPKVAPDVSLQTAAGWQQVERAVCASKDDQFQDMLRAMGLKRKRARRLN